MDNRIGAQFYTITDYCQTLQDFDESCKKVSEIGYKIMQLSGVADFESKEIKEIVDKHNLSIVATHRDGKSYLEDLQSEIDFHKTIDCNICGLGRLHKYNYHNPDLSRETLMEFCRLFTPVCNELKENGLTFAYHNHAFEFSKTDGAWVMDILLDGIKSDNFKLIADVYWLAYAGVNPAKFIREYSDKIACVHFKDITIDKNEAIYCEVGQGNLNWDEIISACNDAQIECALVEQDVCRRNPFDCLETSYDYLKGKGFI